MKRTIILNLLLLFTAFNCFSQTSKSQIFDSLNKMVKDYAITNHSAITLKVHSKDNQLFYTGYNARNQAEIKMFNSTIDIGSCSKMFTASSILQLVEKKKLNLNTKLTSILPNQKLYKDLMVIDGKDFMDSITVLNLLNHSSGLPEYFLEKDDAKEIAMHGDSSLRFTPQQLVNMAKKLNKPSFKPGTGFKYCNTGYIFLGLIIEKVSGMKYSNYVQTHILNPLKMKHTYFGTKTYPANRSAGHFKGAISTMPASMAWSAGELISTLDDMDTFIRAWHDAKLFSSTTAKMVQLEHFLEMGSGIQYGLGVMDILKNQGHAGQTFGFQSFMGYLSNGDSISLGIDDASVSSIMLAFGIIGSLIK